MTVRTRTLDTHAYWLTIDIPLASVSLHRETQHHLQVVIG